MLHYTLHYISGWCITPVDLWSMTLAVLEPNWNTSYSILPSHIISTFESCNHMGHVSLFWVHNITLLLADMTPVTMEKIWEVNLLYKGKQIALSVDTLGVVFFFLLENFCVFLLLLFLLLCCVLLSKTRTSKPQGALGTRRWEVSLETFAVV